MNIEEDIGGLGSLHSTGIQSKYCEAPGIAVYLF